jgi:hypothetical protein
MPEAVDHSRLPLDEQHAAFLRSPFLAMPIAGTIAWTAIGVAGATLPLEQAAWAVFFGTGSIFYLGLAVARFTGEDLLGRNTKGNFFDRVFLSTIGMAVLVYSIAIPFFLIEPTSLPLSVGILAGLMWLPFSALVGHWIGVFHAVTRTASILAAWYAFPDARTRFTLVPAIVVAVYLVTIAILVRRPWEQRR